MPHENWFACWTLLGRVVDAQIFKPPRSKQALYGRKIETIDTSAGRVEIEGVFTIQLKFMVFDDPWPIPELQ